MISNTAIHSDPRLIKNPFMCDSTTGTRLSLDKDPRDKSNQDINFVEEFMDSSGNHHLVSEVNPMLSFCFGKNPVPETTLGSFVDYKIPAEVINQSAKVKHTEGLPLSFIQIETEEQGIEWYKIHYPKIPDDLLPIIARYHWGKPITKKGLKNERKKIEKNLSKRGLSVEHKKVSISFD